MASASATVLPSFDVGSASSALGRAEFTSTATPNALSLPSASWRCHHRIFSSRQNSYLDFSPLAARPAGTRTVTILAMATRDTIDPREAISNALKGLQEAWDKTEDKIAVGGLGFAALIVLWASTGLVSAIDQLPLIPGIFELIGILFSGWFVYHYLLFKPDREELLQKIQEIIAKIIGSES